MLWEHARPEGVYLVSSDSSPVQRFIPESLAPLQPHLHICSPRRLAGLAPHVWKQGGSGQASVSFTAVSTQALQQPAQ